jgi:hypothetical protein
MARRTYGAHQPILTFSLQYVELAMKDIHFCLEILSHANIHSSHHEKSFHMCGRYFENPCQDLRRHRSSQQTDFVCK